jgi:hypothetical protein
MADCSSWSVVAGVATRCSARGRKQAWGLKIRSRPRQRRPGPQVSEQGTALPAAGASVDAATLALGLPGFVVLAAGGYGGELELLIETTESVTGCPRCGVLATLHDRKPRWVRGPARWRSTGGAGVVQAGLALPGRGLRAAHLV